MFGNLIQFFQAANQMQFKMMDRRLMQGNRIHFFTTASEMQFKMLDQKTTIHTVSKSQSTIKDQNIIIEDVSIPPGSSSLDLSMKRLTSLPRDILRLTNLETLILNGNCLVDQKMDYNCRKM